ncbi:MAG: T9SS type A sorting domain-containing protein [Balneolales bacterium]|nr:T9SS type A sorting domain-containing protein [Balneolales bacterium]
MKVENQNGPAEYETIRNTTVAGDWEEITWDMSGAGFTNEWDVIVMIFDFHENGQGDGSENFTWYIDDLEVNVEGIPTSVYEPGNEAPEGFKLSQNYPNPFNPATQIQFQLPEHSEVMLEVFNLSGQRVAVLANGTFQAGTHTVMFDAANLASGMYLYRLSTNSFSQTQKMMLVK